MQMIFSISPAGDASRFVARSLFLETTCEQVGSRFVNTGHSLRVHPFAA